MVKKLAVIMLLFITLTLIACNKSDKILVYEKYIVKYDTVQYVSYLDSINRQVYTLAENNELKVSNGDFVEKDQVLYTLDISSYEEYKRKLDNQISYIHEDINSNNNKIVSLKLQIDNINSEIEICNNSLKENNTKYIKGISEDENNEESNVIEEIDNSDIESQILQYNSEVKLLKEEIEALSTANRQLEMQLKELNIEVEYNIFKEAETAPFAGQVIIEGETIYLYSLDYEIIYNGSEEQTMNFESDKEYIVSKNDKEIGTAKLKYIIPNDAATELGTNAMYKVVFDIYSDESLLRNSIINIVEKGQELLIPFEYVFEYDNKYYVKLNGEEKEVRLEKRASSYNIISGINENDILESYEGKVK